MGQNPEGRAVTALVLNTVIKSKELVSIGLVRKIEMSALSFLSESISFKEGERGVPILQVLVSVLFCLRGSQAVEASCERGNGKRGGAWIWFWKEIFIIFGIIIFWYYYFGIKIWY